MLKRNILGKGRPSIRWVPVAFLALLVVGVGITADAQGPGHGCGHGRGHGQGMGIQVDKQASMVPEAGAGRCDRLCERLDVTDEQREEIEKIRTEAQEQRLAMHKELMRARHALKGELLEDEPSMSTVRNLARKVGEIETQRDIARLEQRMAIRKILTPEQRDRLLFMGQRGGHHRGGPSRGPCAPHGGAHLWHGPRPCHPGAPGAPCAPGAPQAPGYGHGPHGMGRGFQGEWFMPDQMVPGPDDAPAEEMLDYGLLLEDALLDE